MNRQTEWPESSLRPDMALTDELFVRICSVNPDFRLERTAHGDLIIMTPAGSETSGWNADLTYQVAAWVHRTGLGRTFDSSGGFVLPNGAIRAPDVSWITQARWDSLTPEQRQGFAPLCPDFVLELRSPSDRLTEVRAKMREYIDQGARLGWLIDPQRKVVEVYRPGRDVEELQAPTEISGDDVLPDFVLDLRFLFAS